MESYKLQPSPYLLMRKSWRFWPCIQSKLDVNNFLLLPDKALDSLSLTWSARNKHFLRQLKIISYTETLLVKRPKRSKSFLGKKEDEKKRKLSAFHGWLTVNLRGKGTGAEPTGSVHPVMSLSVTEGGALNLPLFGGTERAQTQIPGARLWVWNPQLGDVGGGVHSEKKPCHWLYTGQTEIQWRVIGQWNLYPCNFYCM